MPRICPAPWPDAGVWTYHMHGPLRGLHTYIRFLLLKHETNQSMNLRGLIIVFYSPVPVAAPPSVVRLTVHRKLRGTEIVEQWVSSKT